MSKEIVEVLRVIRYRGTRANVEAVITESIHGTKHVTHAPGHWVKITAQTLDEFPRVLDEEAGEK